MPLDAPGRWGLNDVDSAGVMPPTWATQATNIDLQDGRPRGRARMVEQFSNLTFSNGVTRLHWLYSSSSSSVLIASNETEIRNSADTALTGTITTNLQDSSIHFVNAGPGVIYGIRAGDTVDAPNIKSTAGAAFADVSASAGTWPTGSCGTYAYGRMWVPDSEYSSVLDYSALGDADDWSAASGSGSLDLSNVWTLGADSIVAVHAFGSSLVVFGLRHTVVYSDGAGSDTGIDPDTAYVADVIENVGCIGQQTIGEVAGDLFWVSHRGVESFSRLIQFKDNPLAVASWQVQQAIGTRARNSGKSIATYNFAEGITGRAVPDLGVYIFNDSTEDPMYIFHAGEFLLDPRCLSQMDREWPWM